MERPCHDVRVMSRPFALVRLVLALALAGAAAGCAGSDSEPGNARGGSAGELPAAEAGLGPVLDRRPELLAELGGPDAFVVTVDEYEGTVVRHESWTYYSAGTQIDLVDGEIVWDVEIEPLPDGTFLPLLYDPYEFDMLSSTDEVLGRLHDVELERLPASDDLDIDGVDLYGGEQLLLGFVEDQLVYVETFPAVPGEQEVAS